MILVIRMASVAAIICLTLASASAQTTGSDAAQAPKTNLDTMGGSLSDKLKATGGEIRPQGDVDPAMHKPAPPVGKTPVITPPGGEPSGTGGLY